MTKPLPINTDKEAEEDLEATSDLDDDITFSTANENMEQQMKKNETNPSTSTNPIPENTKTPQAGLISRVHRRVFGGTPRLSLSFDREGSDGEKGRSIDPEEFNDGRGKSVDINKDDAEKSVDQSRLDNNEENEPGSPTPSDILFPRDTDEEAEDEIEEFEENDQEEPAELAIVLGEEEQCQAQLVGDIELGYNTALENPVIDGSDVDSTEPQPVAQKSPSVELLGPTNPTLHKLKSKPPIYNDNSFHYSKPKKANSQPAEKDIYEFSESPEKEKEPQKAIKIVGSKQTSKKSNDKSKKGEKITKRNDEIKDDAATSPAKPRGRPPSSFQNTIAHKSSVIESSIGEKRKPGRPKGTKNGEHQADHVNGLRSSKAPYISNHEDHLQNDEGTSTKNATKTPKRKQTPVSGESLATRRMTGKASGVTMSSPGHVIEINDSQDENDGSKRPLVIKSINAKNSKKRTNDYLSDIEEVVPRSSKRMKTAAVTLNIDEENEHDESTQNQISSQRSSRSQNEVSPQNKAINLIREVASAEELARKAARKVQMKEREWKKAKRVAKELEEAAEHWRNRLELAREQAMTEERVAKGLPPLEKKKIVYDLDDDDEEDFESDVERVEGVFGINNRSNATSSVPWSEEEKEKLVGGLWSFRNAGKFLIPSIVIKYNIFKAILETMKIRLTKISS